MPTLQQIDRSIVVAEELHAIVTTMKSLAAVSVRQYERARENAHAYVENLEHGIQIVLAHGIESRETEAPPETVGVIIFGTEQGLCGPLNHRVLEHAGEWLADGGYNRDKRRILGIGTRLADEMRGYSLDAEKTFAHPSSVAGVGGRIQDVLLTINEWRAAGVTDVVAFHHTRLDEPRAKPVTTRIVPLEPALLSRLREQPWPTNMLPQTAAPPREVFAALVRQLTVARLFISFVEALASEHSERLLSMQGAENNIEERLESLRTTFRREQQSAVTSELLDIISGYELMTAKDSRTQGSS